MTPKEQQRAHVMAQVQHGALDAREAATLLGLSLRHLRRLLAGFRHRGLQALAHGNRGHPSPKRLPEEVRTKILTLARTTSAGLNDHHLTELLAEREKLHVSRPFVRLLLRDAGIGSPRTRRPPRHRRRRERMPQAGLLVQMDGSHHAWLQDRGPRCVLLAAVDDATGRVLAACFRAEEDAQGYFVLLRRVIHTYGLPVALYSDRHSIFRVWPRTPLSVADRLVAELRLQHASTLQDAHRVLNRFLPRYNRRFARQAAVPQEAWRPAPSAHVLDAICCLKYPRTVANDNTVQVGDRLVHLSPGPGGRSYAQARVDVCASVNGKLAVYYHGQRLTSRIGRPSPAITPHTLRGQRKQAAELPAVKHPTPPAPHHPWRRYAETDRRKMLKSRGVTFSRIR